MRRPWHSVLFYVLASAIVLAGWIWRLWLLPVRQFDSDEFAHLHGAWAIWKGMVPYRDYFEHHTPWLHFLLSRGFAFFDVETDPDHAVAALLSARYVMWVFTGIILALTFYLGKQFRSTAAGCAATVFLAGTHIFLHETLEVRPDLPLVSFLLAALNTTLSAIRADQPPHAARRFALAGLFLGAATMFNQKALFILPGFTVAMLWYLLDPRARLSFRPRLGNLALQLLGFTLPIAATLAWFAWHDAGWRFVELNLFLNLRWKREMTPEDILAKFIQQNPFLVILGLVGFLRTGLHMMATRRAVRDGDFLLVLTAASLFVGLYLIPVPWAQYYLMFLPLLAIFQAAFLLDALDVIARGRESWRHALWSSRIEVALFAVLTGAAVWWVFITHEPPFFRSLPTTAPAPLVPPQSYDARAWIAAGCLALLCLALRRRDLALAPLLVVLSLNPYRLMHDEFSVRNSDQLAEVRWLIKNTKPSDTVMDGWRGVAPFRPHAWYYFMLHPGVRAMLSEQEKAALLADLEAEKIRPTIIILGASLADLSPEITAYLRNHYRPVYGYFQRRNPDAGHS